MSQQDQTTEVRFHGRPGLIPQDLIRATNITNEAKVIYGLLSTYKEAFPGQRWIATHSSSSIPTVINRLHELEARGWLLREPRNRQAGETDIYHIFMLPVSLEERRAWVLQLDKTAEEIEKLPARTLLNELKLIDFRKSGLEEKLEALDAQSSKKLEEEEKIKDMQRDETAPQITNDLDSLADKAIDYLNERAGTRFRHSKQSRKYIRARIREGATIEECYLVIDNKASKWVHDPEMSEYLRPSTLFRPSHFEEYLSVAIRWHEGGRVRTEHEKLAGAKALAERGRIALRQVAEVQEREELPPISESESIVLQSMLGSV